MKRIIVALGAILSIAFGPSGAQASENYLFKAQIISPTPMPVGSIILWPTDNDLRTANDSEEWMICDGRELPNGLGVAHIKDYKLLWERIGLTFGPGADPQTFKLPDLRGMFVRGANRAGKKELRDGQWSDPDVAGRTPLKPNGDKDAVGSVQMDQFRSHKHNIDMRGMKSGDGPWTFVESADNHGTTDSAGGNETRPKNLYLNYLIKVKDIGLGAN